MGRTSKGSASKWQDMPKNDDEFEKELTRRFNEISQGRWRQFADFEVNRFGVSDRRSKRSLFEYGS